MFLQRGRGGLVAAGDAGCGSGCWQESCGGKGAQRRMEAGGKQVPSTKALLRPWGTVRVWAAHNPTDGGFP